MRTPQWCAVALHGILLVSMGAGAGVAAPAGPDPVIIGEKRTLHSERLDEDREVWVYVPESDGSSDARYPVLYLLDGESHFHHSVGAARFLATIRRIPELIVVGIVNPSFSTRSRDLTPRQRSDRPSLLPSTGGADEFLGFLATELIPFVEREYRTEPFRILAGHSLGGLFAVHALINRPDIFRAYIPISPSLWWDESSAVTEAAAFFKSHPESSGFLYITRGDERQSMRVAIRRFVRVLRADAPDSFRWKFSAMEDEDHHSAPHRGLYAALEWLFTDWRVPDPLRLADEGGIEAFDAHFAHLSERFGYTIRTPEIVLLRAAGELMSADRVDEAIVMLEASARRFPESAGMHDTLGDAYRARGDLEPARDSYRRACDLATESADPFLPVYKIKLDRVSAALAQE